MRQRIFWTIFIVCFGWVLLGLWASFVFFTNYYEKQILLHLQQNSHYIEIGLKQQGISYLSHINTAYRVSLIDSHGKVVYDNLALKEALDNHAERIEFKESMQNGVAQSYRYSQSMQQEMLYHAVKIMLDRGLIESSLNSGVKSSGDLKTYLESKLDLKKSVILDSNNCHVEQSEISSIESKKDISCLRTRTSKALAHTCKYDKVLESKP
ncbi:MAG: hypothetical protein SPJ16_06845, partial [Helicobacter sp.]|nr:hypothetical protein [Helicobacter sp.]